ncbi:hypothetical protein M0R72_13955 [Candidatus Pacearchaeota archaeon]|jgi:hypothetical protein|nr:hypothetical protein [Candidatus Pacearchaeota archaeon]
MNAEQKIKALEAMVSELSSRIIEIETQMGIGRVDEIALIHAMDRLLSGDPTALKSYIAHGGSTSTAGLFRASLIANASR